MPRNDEYDDEYGDRYDDDRPRSRRDDRDYDDREQDRDDYEDRPRRGGTRARARERVLMPAIFLMISGGLGFAYAVFNAAVFFSGVNENNPNPLIKEDPNMKNDPAYKAGQYAVIVGTIIGSALVIVGGLQMKNLKNRGFVMFTSILAMTPCNCCCLLGIPFGIWSLVVLNDETVKRAF
jgi:hypothetical protein